MINKIVFRLFLVLCFGNCSNNNYDNIHLQNFGIIIVNSARHGQLNYFNISTTFSNDTLIPVHLKISFLKQYVHNNKKFRIILLPESMTVEKLRNNGTFIQNFLQSDYSNTLNKIIKPKENYTVNIAFINDNNSNVIPGQLALISKLHKFNFGSIPDSLIKQDGRKNDSLNISLGLNFSVLTDSVYGFKLIPCGTIYYSN